MTRALSHLFIALVLLASQNLSSHELDATRLTLVQRDTTHVSATLHANLARLMSNVLAPQLNRDEFLVVHAAMAPDTFNAQFAEVKRTVAAGSRFDQKDGSAVKVNWVWPEAKLAQEQIREQAMKLATGDDDHWHQAAFEVRIDLQYAKPVGELSVRLPAVALPAMIVSYRPTQIWHSTPAKASSVTFR